MPGCGIPIGFLDECLVMPDTESLHSGQLAEHPAQGGIQHKLFRRLVETPEIQALGKNLVVVAIASLHFDSSACNLLFAHIRDGSYHRLLQFGHFLRRKKSGKMHEAVLLIS